MNDHISKLENHIKDMYDELVNEFYEKKHTDRVLANKDLKIAGLSSDVKKLRVENREKDRTIQTICHDLTKAKNLTLASAIQAKFKQMYVTYVRSEQAKSIAHIAGGGSSDGATVQEVRVRLPPVFLYLLPACRAYRYAVMGNGFSCYNGRDVWTCCIQLPCAHTHACTQVMHSRVSQNIAVSYRRHCANADTWSAPQPRSSMPSR